MPPRVDLVFYFDRFVNGPDARHRIGACEDRESIRSAKDFLLLGDEGLAGNGVGSGENGASAI